MCNTRKLHRRMPFLLASSSDESTAMRWFLAAWIIGAMGSATATAASSQTNSIEGWRVLVNEQLLLELKAVREVAPEHVAQLLGYLKPSRIEHGALFNFGAGKFHIKTYGMSQTFHEASAE